MSVRWWLSVFASLVACQPNADRGPSIPSPTDCEAHVGPEIGTWRRVAYLPGSDRASGASDGQAFIVPGGPDCFFCQVGFLERGQGEWEVRSYLDPLTSATAASSLLATPTHVVAVGLQNTGRNLAAYGQVAVLDRARETWALHAFPEDFPPRYDMNAHWTGTLILLWGGYDSNRSLLDPDWIPDPEWIATVHSGGLLLDPATGAFRHLPPALAPVVTGTGQGSDPRYDLASVWTPDGLVVWGVHPHEQGALLVRYSPEEDAWSTLKTSTSPPRRAGHQLIHGDGSIYLFSGSATRVGESGDEEEARCGALLDDSCWDLWRLHLDTLEWEPIEVPAFVGLHTFPTGPRRTGAFVDGRLMIAGSACPGVAIYDPERDEWELAVREGAPSDPFAVQSVGSELYFTGKQDVPTAASGGAVWIFDPGK